MQSLLLRKLDRYADDVKSGRLGSSVSNETLEWVTAIEKGSENALELLMKDLEELGISNEILISQRVRIKDWFQEAIALSKLDKRDALSDDAETQDEFYSVMEETRDGQEAIKPDNENANTGSEATDGPPLDLNEALLRSSVQWHTQGIAALLDFGADINYSNSVGRTALHFASSSGSVSVVQLLLHGGANVERRDSSGRTPMWCSMENGHFTVARSLLRHGANPNERFGLSDRTPLHWSASRGQEDFVELLISSGADVNAQDNGGLTAAHIASWSGHTGVLRKLLQADAKTDMEDVFGDTALDLARKSPSETGKREQVVRLLLENFISSNDALSTAILEGKLDPEDILQFSLKESIFDRRSEENVFNRKEDFGEILPRQFAMNQLAEELFDVIIHSDTKH